jgi:hypothetical protein
MDHLRNSVSTSFVDLIRDLGVYNSATSDIMSLRELWALELQSLKCMYDYQEMVTIHKRIKLTSIHWYIYLDTFNAMLKSMNDDTSYCFR